MFGPFIGCVPAPPCFMAKQHTCVCAGMRPTAVQVVVVHQLPHDMLTSMLRLASRQQCTGYCCLPDARNAFALRLIGQMFHHPLVVAAGGIRLVQPLWCLPWWVALLKFCDLEYVHGFETVL